MKYNIPEEKLFYSSEQNTVKKVINSILSLLILNEDEKQSLLKVQTPKDLQHLINNPQYYFTDHNVKKFEELSELIDLVGGIYYA